MRTKKVKGSSSNGFAFEFGGGTQKVKAVVARKRPLSKNVIDEKSNGVDLKLAPKSVAIRKMAVKKPNTVATKSAIVVKNDVKAQYSDNDSDVDTYLKMAKPSQADTADLMLNICTAPTTTKKIASKVKLSQQERLKQKREARKGNGPLNKRTLTHKELRDGLKKFSQNPNQKPRASDIFEQKEREERQKSSMEQQKAEGESVEEAEKEPLDLGEVDLHARKANAFRVKRPGDSSVRKIGLFKDQPEKIELGQRLVRPITEKIFDGAKVESLGLHPHTVKNLSDVLGITMLTTVQQKSIPKALEGKLI